MVDPITANAVLSSAGSHRWNIAKGFVGAVETNSDVLAKFLTYAKSNGVFAAVPGPVSADSPALGCLYRTLVGPSDVCPFGNYVFYTGRNMGKSSALRIFCSKTLNCKTANRRSIYVSGLGSSLVYFENVAGNLDVVYTSNGRSALYQQCVVRLTRNHQSSFLMSLTTWANRTKTSRQWIFSCDTVSIRTSF